jgi:hypothetical protein
MSESESKTEIGNIRIGPDQLHHGTGDPLWLLDRLRAAFDEFHELERASCWALVKRSLTAGIWLDIAFVEFAMSRTDGSEMLVHHLLSVSGPVGGLREARHSNWGSEGSGYVFHMSFANVRAALKFLEQYFDGD